MRAAIAGCFSLLMWAAGAGPPVYDLKSLDDAHNWIALRDALTRVKGPALYQGAVAVAFNDVRKAESTLRSVIKSEPRSEQAYEAYKQLAHLYITTGQYRRLVADLEQKWAVFPEKNDLPQERTDMAPFWDLPDQISSEPRVSSLHHKGSLFIPLTINGRSARYFLDTGAGMSSMSESEARRLGLRIREARGSMGVATGGKTEFRTAVAEDLSVGHVRLKNVSFAVFRDDQEPWVLLSPGERGLLGIPVLLAFGTLRWAQDGTVEIGSNSGRRKARSTDLYFDEDHLVAAAEFRDSKLPLTLDTGAEATDLYGAFAQRFADLIGQSGTRESKEVRGVGHAEHFEAITVPELVLRVGGFQTTLRPAHVLLKQVGLKYCFGNLGLDLLKQAQAFAIDFRAMTLDLEATARHHLDR